MPSGTAVAALAYLREETLPQIMAVPEFIPRPRATPAQPAWLDGLLKQIARRGALLAALLCALSRASFSAEPATALVAGYIGCVWPARAVRTVVESDGPLPRTVLVASSAFLLCIFWGLVRTARNLDPLAASSIGLAAAVDAGLKIALATGLASLALLPLILRLPGLTTLRGRMT